MIDLLTFRLVALLFRLIVPTSDAEALQRIAPEPISVELARANIAAARIAAAVVFPDQPTLSMADDLLAIARRESHYQLDARTPYKGLVSCGAMTPTPLASCETTSAIGGYMAGAIHLRGWIEATRTLDEASRGYSGGWRLIRACREAPVIVERKGAKIDLCNTPKIERWWAARIREERWRAAS